MSSNQSLRCGVAGVGYLGQHHARIYAALPQTELVGVFDSDLKRARQIAKEHGGVVFDTLEQLGEACDAVSVVTPTDSHSAVAQTLLGQGCHLLIEKPICTTLDEAAAINAEAARCGRIVQVGHIEHYNPVMTYLEDKVHDPRYITADRLAPFKERGIEVSVILDLMIHDIGIILQLARSPLARVDAVGVNVLTKTVDNANARLTFESGCVANLNVSRVSMKPVREIRVFQPQTYLSLDFANQKGHYIRKGSLPGMLGLSKKEIPIEKDEPLKIELASFAEAVCNHGKPKVDAYLGTSALEVALRVSEEIGN